MIRAVRALKAGQVIGPWGKERPLGGKIQHLQGSLVPGVANHRGGAALAAVCRVQGVMCLLVLCSSAVTTAASRSSVSGAIMSDHGGEENRIPWSTTVTVSRRARVIDPEQEEPTETTNLSSVVPFLCNGLLLAPCQSDATRRQRCPTPCSMLLVLSFHRRASRPWFPASFSGISQAVEAGRRQGCAQSILSISLRLCH